MRTISQLLLTFLLNACWQVVLIAAFASFSSWLLRTSSARYRHWIWVTALFLSLGIPLATSARLSRDMFPSVAPTKTRLVDQATAPPLVIEGNRAFNFDETVVQTDAFVINRTLGLVLLAIYLGFLCFGAFRLLSAFNGTRRLRSKSLAVPLNQELTTLVHRCASSISNRPATAVICSSESVPVPITIGILKPVIILPHGLLQDRSDEILTSAIGHELIHVQRRDYAFNLLYELVYLILSFHPAAALIRRRIRQTRELSCDELVAERILHPEVYARSLLQLASSAPTLRRLSVSTTVGIADADILEARIMSLLRKPKIDTRRKRITLIAISLMLLVPCLAAVSFAMKFDLLPSEPEIAAQEPSQEREREAKGSLIEKKRMDEEEFKRKMQTDPKFREEVEAKWELERKMRAARQAALLRLARITMDQAIQIATSQQPGKVLECTLNAEHWEEPGKLAKDGFVFYHVVIVSEGDSEEGIANHVLVNAVDGTIIRKEKELPRKMMRPE